MPSICPIIRTRNGMVVSPHYLASFEGARILREGGNAVPLIKSIYYPFGSGMVVGDTGIIL